MSEPSSAFLEEPRMATKVRESAPGIEPERMYSYAEIAVFASSTERRVRRWVEDGRIDYIQLPRGRRILGRHYAAFIASREVTPAA
jgi:hypothetical protein